MNLDLGGPGAGCSALRVRRLMAGELAGVEKERTEAHVAECARCAAVQVEIAAEREALRRDVPFPQFAAAVAEKLAQRPKRSFAMRWAPLAAAAGLALVAGTALVLRPADTETVRSKGGAVSAHLFVQDKSGVHELAEGDPVAEGAHLQLSVKPADHKRLAVILIEPGEASVIYEGAAVSLLPGGFEWTGKGVATLLVVLSDAKVDVSSIRDPKDVPRGSEVLAVTLRR